MAFSKSRKAEHRLFFFCASNNTNRTVQISFVPLLVRFIFTTGHKLLQPGLATIKEDEVSTRIHPRVEGFPSENILLVGKESIFLRECKIFFCINFLKPKFVVNQSSWKKHQLSTPQQGSQRTCSDRF